MQVEDFDKADQLAREYSDYLLFLINDLGWGDPSPAHHREFELITAPEVLRRVMERLHVAAATQRETDRRRTRAARADESYSEYVMTTCSDVLGKLEAGTPMPEEGLEPPTRGL